MSSLLSRLRGRRRPSPEDRADASAPAERPRDTAVHHEPVQGTELLSIDFKSVGRIAWSPDGSRLAAAAQGGTDAWNPEVKVWDATTGAEVLEVGHRDDDRSDRASTVGFSPDGSRLLTAGHRSARIWDATTGKELLAVRHGGATYEQLISAAVFAPDGTRMATAGVDGTARIWDIATAAEVLRISERELTGQRWVHDVAFGPDGTWLATACQEGLRVNDAETGEERFWLPTRAPVYRVAVSADGTLLAADVEHQARVYDAPAWTERLTVHQQGEAIDVDLAADSARLATVHWLLDRTCIAEVWDTTTGDGLAWARCGHGPAALDPAGARLATRSLRVDGLKIWGVVGTG